MTKLSSYSELSRRERQVMEILHRRGKATAAEILADLPDQVTDGAIRSVLRLLRQKELVRYLAEGKRYVYEPIESPARVQRSALANVVATFFQGSRERAVAALLSGGRLTAEEYASLRKLIDDAKPPKGKGKP